MAANDEQQSTPPVKPNEPIEAVENTEEGAEGEEKREKREIVRRPQTFVEYDVNAMDVIIERRDREELNATFGGPEKVFALLKTDVEKGITQESWEARREQWGVNELERKEPPSFLDFLLEALSDQVILILIGAAIVSIIFGMTLENPHTHKVERDKGWIEGVAILASVVVVSLVGSISNYEKAKKFEEMEKDQEAKSVNVTRDGVIKSVDSTELVPGDLVEIEGGMQLNCDYIVVRPQSLKMDEAAVTGETDLVPKLAHGNCFLLAGTSVEDGAGDAIVVAIGMESNQGLIKAELNTEEEATPLQEHLEWLAEQIGKFGLGAAVLLIFALSLKEVIRNSTEDDRTWSAVPFLSFFLIAVALVAVAIPEGLPLAVTIALAFSMKAMAKDNCLVRLLASCETMGAATAVCSDKTGTLTKNEMTVVQGLVGGKEFMFGNAGLKVRDADAVTVLSPEDATKDPAALGVTSAVGEIFAKAVALNSTAVEAPRDGKIQWGGNKTEQGMLKFLPALGFDYKKVREAANEKYAYPFSSAKKRMTTVERTAPGASDAWLYTKGASEKILESCTKMFSGDGSIVDMDDATRKHYDAIIVDMAKQGNRTIGVARAEAPVEVGTGDFPLEDMTDAQTLVWIGVVGIQDPMRPEVPAAVTACNTAGITVRMVTGDNIHTARAIAAKCGFYDDNGFDYAMEGPQFREMSENDKPGLMELLPRLRVLARSSPTDKLILVELLQELGEVVAVTGDGTNDAPALHRSNVGFAMNSGTDIARSAAAMVLLDDNFASVVNAVRWGRAVNDNIKKFLQFQLAINVGGVLLTIVGSLASEKSKEPFTPVQLLWLNMIMDTLAALSLATELPEDASLTRRPVYKQASIITNRMRVFILCHAAFQFTMIMLILFLGHKWFETIDSPDTCAHMRPADETFCREVCEEVGGVYKSDTRYCQQGRKHSAMIFNIFIWFQVFNVINGRKIYGELNPLEGVMTRSQSLVIIFALIGGLQALAIEFAGDFMSVTSLTAREWGISIGFGALSLVVGMIVRLVPIEDVVPEEIIAKEARIAGLREKHHYIGISTADEAEQAGSPHVE